MGLLAPDSLHISMKSLFAPLLLVFIADFLVQFKTRCSMRFVDQPPILEGGQL
jgi:hypothetical protein